jgi:hypothetical protein
MAGERAAIADDASSMIDSTKTGGYDAFPARGLSSGPSTGGAR